MGQQGELTGITAAGMVAAMFSKLVSCLLALAVALVFSGETASAGGLCHREKAQVVVAAEAPCHEASHHGDQQAQPVKDKHHTSLCDCVAMLKASFGGEPPLASSHVEPWRWRTPEVERFASLELAPEGPPPKG